MKLLVVSRYDRSARAINTIMKYVRVGKALGHEVALFADPMAICPMFLHPASPRRSIT